MHFMVVMWNTQWIVIFIIGFLGFSISDQMRAQDAVFMSSIQAYEKAISSTVLVQNEDSFLPVKRLDSIAFYCVQFGSKFQHVLDKALLRYAPFTMPVPDQISSNKKSLIVLVLRQDQYEVSEINSINTLLKHHDVAAILNDVELFTTFPDIVLAKSIILQLEETPLHNELLAQQIFGGATLNTSKISDATGQVLNSHISSLDGKFRLGFAPPAMFGADGSKLEKRIDAIAVEGLDSMAYPGCQILVAKKGKVIFQKTYGYHTYDHIRPVQREDLYDLASVTKISSATTALMKLYGEGKFDLDAPLKKYFPKFSKTDKANLQWRQILAHNARLKSWIPYWTKTLKKNGKYKAKTLKPKPSKRYPIRLADNLYLHKNYKEKKIYKMIAKSPMNKQPGYLYSGLSFYLYPEIIENISGQPFEGYLKSNVYNKIGATTITYNPMRYYSLDQIVPTENDTFFRMTQLHGVVHDEGAAMMNGVSANAGLFASTLDLTKLMQLFLNCGQYGADVIIQPEAIDEFTRCQYCEEGNRRGLGFEKPMIEYDSTKSHVSKYVSKKSFGHSGYTGTFAWADPEHEIIFIFMSNRVYPTRLNRKLYTMNIRPRIQDVIYEELLHLGNVHPHNE